MYIGYNHPSNWRELHLTHLFHSTVIFRPTSCVPLSWGIEFVISITVYISWFNAQYGNHYFLPLFYIIAVRLFFFICSPSFVVQLYIYFSYFGWSQAFGFILRIWCCSNDLDVEFLFKDSVQIIYNFCCFCLVLIFWCTSTLYLSRFFQVLITRIGQKRNSWRDSQMKLCMDRLHYFTDAYWFILCHSSLRRAWPVEYSNDIFMMSCNDLIIQFAHFSFSKRLLTRDD